MRAAQYREFGGPIEIVEVAEPAAPADGVVVRVEATGVCRSDWHAWHGLDDDVSLPHIPGHEFAGVVVARGADVAGHHVGQRVIVPFILGCGVCETCARGDAQICPNQVQPGFHLPGSFAEFVAVPHADFNLVAIPDELTMSAAAGLGCRYTTAWRAVTQQGRLAAGERLLVVGCGGVGLAAIQIGRALDVEVVAIDPSLAARDHAEQFGAFTASDWAALVPGSVDVVVDGIGDLNVLSAALPLLRPGGRFVQVGIMEGPAPVQLSLNHIMRQELEIVGSHGIAARGIPELLDLVRTGRLDPEAVVTDRVDLARGIDHLQHMHERPGHVVLIEGIAP